MAEIVEITVDTSEIEEKVKILRHIKLGAERAVMRTLNRALDGMATDAGKEVVKIYDTKQKHFKGELEKERATPKNLSVVMRSKGRPMRLVKFRTEPNKQPGVKGAPSAFAQVKKSSGGARITSAFTANVRAGSGSHSGIFMRTGKPSPNLREGIRQLHGPGKVQMLDNPEIREIIQKQAVERFNKRLDTEIKHLLDKSNNV